MRAALAEAKGWPVIEYAGRSVWGVGHLLSQAFTLHYLRLVLRRYCYVRLWDSQLDGLSTRMASWSPSVRVRRP